VRRINAEFIPIALKAGLVNDLPGDDEGRLYREIARSRPAPQGICVINPAGKVLDWALMFDDDRSVLAFLDHALTQYARYPDAGQPVPAERYMKFPSQMLETADDTREPLPLPDRHPAGAVCPAAPPPPAGTATARVFGRALDMDGKPVADTIKQEHYVEDRFDLPPDLQQRLAEALARAGSGPAALPIPFTRELVAHAFLGMLDVQPLSNPAGSPGQLRRCSFTARPVGSAKGVAAWRVDGQSDAYIGAEMANAGPGDMHEIKLIWHGLLEMHGPRLSRLLLTAVGTERLRYQSSRDREPPQVSILPGGHRIDQDCRVRYGIIAAPAR
jgi:hypothetical protein